MDPITKKSKAARRRMIVSRFLAFLPYSLSAMLLVAAVGVMLPKVIVLQVDSQIWYTSWLASAAFVGLLVSAVMTWLGRPTLVDAAAEIDRRFELRQRLASALLLTPPDRQSNLGHALTEDANRRADGLDIPAQFKWGVHRWLLLPILPALLSLLFFALTDRQPPNVHETSQSLTPTQVKNSTQPLLEQIRKKQAEAQKQNLEDVAQLYDKLADELEKMRQQPNVDNTQALAKLNDIKQELEERRKELGGADALKKNLQTLDKLEDGPADKLTQAMKEGDFEKAEKALGELLEDLKEGKLDGEKMEKLAKQVEQLEKSLREAVQAHEQAKKELQKQIRQAQEAGDMQRAGQLQRKLEQMQAADASMEQLSQMADQLSQCQQCMKDGDKAGLKESLDQMAEQLGQMNSENAQLQDLDELMDQLCESKSNMFSEDTDQMSNSLGSDEFGMGSTNNKQQVEDGDVDYFDSQIRDEMKVGENIFAGKIGGENRKGVSRVEVQQEIARELASEPEALDETPLPRNQRDHTRDYFNQLRGK